MKILVTGTTPLACGRSESYDTFSVLLPKIFQARGDEVEVRPVIPGENLDQYDIIVISFTKLNSVGSYTYRYGALWALHAANRVLAVLDDWQVREFMTGLKPRYIWDYPTNKMRSGSVLKAMEAGAPYRQQLDRAIGMLASGMYPMLLPATMWGDHAKLKALVPMAKWFLDPSTFQTPYEIRPMAVMQRSCMWVSAAMSAPLENVRAKRYWESVKRSEWPVHRLFAKVRGARFSRASEVDVVDEYTKHWGVLSSPYGHAGSGWWRARFRHATLAKAIMFADPDEVRGLGDSYLYAPADLNGRSTRFLEDLAFSQWLALFNKTPTTSAVMEQLSNIVHSL